MNIKMFSIYDQKAEAYNAPFCFNAVGQAIRAFADLANDPQSNINKHPADYNLFEIAVYDDQSASITPLGVNINLGCAIEFIDHGDFNGELKITREGDEALQEY